MKGLREKFQNKKGFTLVEMLIVVAIVAILIAISIPMVKSAIEKAKDATDDANFRSAAGLGSIEYLANDNTGTYIYYTNKAAQGQLVSTAAGATVPTGYNKYISKCTSSTGGSDHGVTGTKKNQNIQVVIGDDGDITVSWVDNS